jgi:hypothetical protein
VTGKLDVRYIAIPEYETVKEAITEIESDEDSVHEEREGNE